MSSILSYLNDHQEWLLRDLEQLVQVESPSDQKREVDKCGRFAQKLFRERIGATVQIYPQPVAGDHLRFSIGEADRQILILGHLDTVWEIGRLAYRVAEGRAFGPGIFDMKGGIVQALWALRALLELRISLPCKVVFLLTSDEESGSQTSRQLIENQARESSVVLVVEPPVAGTDALKTARKGVGRFVVRITGKAAHAGNNPQEGVSAVEEMAHQILRLHAMNDYSVGTTVNAGMARGGKRLNVVAEEAEIQVDLRVSSMAEGERLSLAIRALVPVLAGATISVQGGLARPPMERNAGTVQLFHLAAECARSLGFALTEATVGGGSDGNFTAALGIPTLDGLGAVGRGIHAEDEQIVIDQLPLRAALFGELILAIGREWGSSEIGRVGKE
jgi:glutamate carboxypeptidase